MIETKSRETNINIWVELLIFISSYYPLFLILLIKDVNSNTVGLQFGLPHWELYVSIWALIGIFISSGATLATGRLMKFLFTRAEGSKQIRLIEAQAVRGDMINYTLPFLIGLFAFDYKSIQSVVSLLVFLTFMFAFSRKDKLILLNPMFLLLGMRLYEIKYKRVGQPNAVHSASALCRGVAKASDTKVRFLENSGITFISALVDR
ncbi:hypothetical protein ACLINW_000703 [Vibrio parahaemolyticus]|uniref:hypothetical protein n=1 Tax=Vibrio parahaemolyticus TaxID=670 RepID=UPI000472A7EE|nr:hypothetical protein [Vibrio parahaemolyticus]EHZ2738171.1 hypothetical protein [Vibrio parahaemolyticus]EIA1562714.1 hypothetical protein [Vibrio parahaemolyticus]EJG1722543.1 hypothetical protein [Vibrio parahaemolyticus]EJG1735833.1 hypothetical protein [Vibrio parahaemolyticus]EJG1750926.1 hypothetical protein [Vibrio parahaemolyticus]